MAIAASLLPEFDHEMGVTRRVLERLPADRMGWRPHAKSWTLGALATHLATIPGWTAMTIAQDSLDMAPVGGEPPRTVEAGSPAEVLQRFDANVAEARAAIAGASDETLLAPWTLLKAGQAVFTQPRAAILRSFVMSHSVHHRAQLAVYFRLCDVPVPAIYGPSADDPGM